MFLSWLEKYLAIQIRSIFVRFFNSLISFIEVLICSCIFVNAIFVEFIGRQSWFNPTGHFFFLFGVFGCFSFVDIVATVH